MHRLDGFVKKHFKGVRITEKIDKDLENLYKQKAELKNKEDPVNRKKLEKVETEMANRNADIIKISARLSICLNLEIDLFGKSI